jgi:rod shape-determining protein MreC
LAFLASAMLMAVDHRYDHLRVVRSTFATLLYPLQWLADSPITLVDWASETFASRRELLLDNAQLHAENLKLHGQQQKMIALEAENMRLRGLLGTSFKVGERVLIAELMAVDLAPYRQQVLVDKGTRSGVYVGQAVLNADAVIGQVTEVTPFTATVLMITDAAHALPVRNHRTGRRTIAVGTGKVHRLSLPYLPNNTKFEVGDLLVTSGMGRHFPTGYPVARVVNVERRPGDPFSSVIAEPIAKLDRIREVLLVWSLDEGPAPLAQGGQAASEDEAATREEGVSEGETPEAEGDG